MTVSFECIVQEGCVPENVRPKLAAELARISASLLGGGGSFADADVVFLGLQEPEPGEEAAYADRIIKLSGGLNTCIFVRSADEFAGRLV